MVISDLHNLFLESEGVCTDTRSIKKNQLFFAIKGENFDGNLYAEEALSKGASYAVVEDRQFSGHPKAILVKNVLKTLQDLANYHRKQFNIPVIGITGSNGKTTSKELVNAVLEQKYKTLVTEGNLNNHLGVPFTLLKINDLHEIAIVEMGANKPGDIKELAEIAQPTYGVITNIGKAHLEGFGSLEGVINTKTEMYRNIASSKGAIFVNTTDTLLTNQIIAGIEVIGYGNGANNVSGEVVEANPFIAFNWQIGNYQSNVLQTQLVGSYNLSNFLLAICIGQHFKVDVEKINQAIESYSPSNNRSQVTKTTRNTLIVDCYNANPSSMKSAIYSFKTISANSKLMILGDMLELGSISEAEHRAVYALALTNDIETIYVGNIFKSLYPKNRSYTSVEDLIEKENLQLFSDRTILLKGSRGIKLEKLIDKL
ncbi:MAG: UDP-N-acetylmuramoyl-tripeptide--D-alanyl-D-alanine ligase [Crocinitomicaceae bacterium]